MSGSAGLDLSILYRGGAAASAGSGNPILALRTAEKNKVAQIAAEARKPEVQRDLAAFRKAVAGAKDVKSLLGNPTALRVLLTANGLGDQAAYPALAIKALTSKLTDPKSLANALPDARWKRATATYEFADKGLSVLRDPNVLNTLASAYAEISWRKSLNAATPGLSDALAFRESAAAVRTAYDILGNAALRRVVTTTLGIPPQIAFQSLTAQEKAISTRLDISRLQDKKFVDSFTQRYLIAAAGTNADAGAPSLDQLALQARGFTV